jgi:signal transduction histidine kinase
MQAIGGQLAIESSPGRGTTATVTLELDERRYHPTSLQLPIQQ